MGQKLIDVGPEYGIFGIEQRGYASGISFVDFDQDGDDDITLGSEEGHQLLCFRNDGTKFTQIFLHENLESQRQINWVDFDNDKDLDLQISSETEIRLFENIGGLELIDITEQAGIVSHPGDVDGASFPSSWADYNEDGLLDLLLTFRSFDTLQSISLYRNNGDKTFTEVSTQVGIPDTLGRTPLATGFMDFNNDHYEDILIVQDYSGGHILLLNNQDGSFTDMSATSGLREGDLAYNGMTATIGDINFDGYMDIYMTNTREDAFFVNNRDGSFTPNTAFYGLEIPDFTFGANFLDLDCDTDLDLFVVRHGLMMNGTTLDSYFELDPEVFINEEVGVPSTSIISGDFNGDGYPDLVGNKNLGTILYQNNVQKNNWLTIKARGTVSNYFAVGTRLILESDGKEIIRHIQCGQDFSSQQSYTQFFGLAEDKLVEKLTITWPNGMTEEYFDLEANTHYNFTEGEGYDIKFKYTGFSKVSPCDSISPTIISAQGKNVPFAYKLYDDQNIIIGEGELEDQFQKDTINLDAGNYRIQLTDQDNTEIRKEFLVIKKEFEFDIQLLDLDKVGFDCDGTRQLYDLVFQIDGYYQSHDFDPGIAWAEPESTEMDTLSFSGIYIDPDEYKLNIETGCGTFEYPFTIEAQPENFGLIADIENASGPEESDGSAIAQPSFGIEPYHYTWYNSNGWIFSNEASVDSLTAGWYRLRVTDSMDCRRSLDVTIDFSSKINNQSNYKITISPNPTIDFILIESEVHLDKLKLYNEQGQFIRQLKNIYGSERIDVSDLSAGIYFYSYDLKGIVYTGKIIKN